MPWLLSLRTATPRQAWNRGYGFGLLFSLTQLWWLGDLAYRWTGSVVLGLVPWLVASLLSAVYYGLLGRLVREAPAWTVPLVWAGMEVLRSYIPVLAFPWALVAEPLVGTPLRGLAWFGTVYLASAAVVAVNVAIVNRNVRALAAVGAAWALALGVWLYFFERPASRLSNVVQRVAAGQTGVDMAVADGSDEWRLPPAIDALVAEGVRRRVDLLVMPEGIARVPTLPPHLPFSVPDRPVLVFGGQRGAGPVYQSAFAHAGQDWAYADKTRLVIFGEFVPGRDLLPFLQAFHLPSGDLSAGDKLAQLSVGGWRVGPLVCFEALFPDLAYRQAVLRPDVLAVMSIDDWFAPPARERLADASRWRATEAGLPLVRAGSLGRTMVLDPRGNVLADAPYGGRRLVVAELEGGRGPFPLVWLFPAVALASLVGVPLMKRRKATAPRAE